jgi:lipopolysaccharide transport system ATP-binding protein
VAVASLAVPSISVRGLSKVFDRRDTSRSKGISTEGPAAMSYLLRQTFRRASRAEVPERGDKRALWALEHLNFDVMPGEVLGIIGRNGAGKSTLLKILARVLHPTTGHITIRGRVVSMLELGIGLAPELSVRQNIEVQGRLAGVPARQIRAAEDAILEAAGLASHRDVALYECPSGAAVRLGFATMIGLGADIVLADEVLAVGDSAFREACEARVRAAGESGESVLFVSHDMAAIRRICTRVIWIDKGRIVRDGPTEEVVSAYTSELLAGRLLPPLTGQGLEDSCRLLDTRLLDEHHAPVGALQLTKPGYIDCLVRVSRRDVAALLDIELWREKRCLFKVTSRPITARQPTTFRAGIEIPADFLNELSYQARFRLRAVDISAPDQAEAVAAEERLDFAAMNPTPEESVWNDWPWNRNGLVSPRLAWTVHDA